MAYRTPGNRTHRPLILVFVATLFVACGDTFGNDFLPGTVDVARDTRDAVDVRTEVWEAGPDRDADAEVDDAPEVAMTTCELWRAEYPTRAAHIWSRGPDDCAPGTLDPTALEDGLRRTNLYRRLVGLPPIVNNTSFSEKAQLCAVLQRAMGTLNHTPPQTARCYTVAGAEGAASSNLAMGVDSLARAVDLFLADDGVRSLGHRRWLLHPPYRHGGFGFADGYVCQWVFGWGADPGIDPVALPPEGEFPIEALPSVWSLSSSAGPFTDATVTVTRLSDGASLQLDVWVAPGTYGLETIAWRPSERPAPGEYRIQVTAGPRSWDYTTNLLDCW